jgi:hypothetical protein
VPELLGQIIEGPTMRPTSVISERRLAPRARLGAKFDAWFFRACAVMPTSRFSTAVEQTEALREALAADRDA